MVLLGLGLRGEFSASLMVFDSRLPSVSFRSVFSTRKKGTLLLRGFQFSLIKENIP